MGNAMNSEFPTETHNPVLGCCTSFVKNSAETKTGISIFALFLTIDSYQVTRLKK